MFVVAAAMVRGRHRLVAADQQDNAVQGITVQDLDK
jgi:hypothetical protein